MAGGPPGGSEVAPFAVTGPGDLQRQTRYNYLVGRLRSRQITMEEATELFAILQAMLRASETARLAAVARPSASPSAPPGPVARSPGATPAGPDDLLLVGLLAMGAGAGLLAAMAQRLATLPAPATREGKGPGTGRTA